MSVPIIKLITLGLLPSPLKKLYYQACGAKIGKNVSFGFFSIIDSKDIELGDDFKMGHISYISANKIKIGKRVAINMLVAAEIGELEMGNDSIILDRVTIGGMLTPKSKLIMGERAKIFSFSFINPTDTITLEDDVGVGGGSYIFTHSSWLSILDGYPVTFGPVTVRKNVWLPWRVFILPNVEIGENCVIGANSLVTANIPANSLAAGSPAKVILGEKKFLRVPSEEKKDQILKDIFEAFAKYLQFNGNVVTVAESGNNTVLTIESLGQVLYCKTLENVKATDADVFVSLQPIPEKLRKNLNENNKDWFDIANKETKLSTSKIWEVTKGFLGRYGIRFKILD